MAASDTPECVGVYLLTHPRSASNMFQRMMEKQPGYQQFSYKLFDAGFAAMGQLQRGPLSGWPEEDRKGLHDAFWAGFESLEKDVAEAKSNGKQAFIKEHAMLLTGPEKLYASVHGEEADSLLPSESESPESSHTNPTSLPDRFLFSVQPIFQIRHPALMFPSMLRAQSRVMPDTDTRNPRLYCSLTLRHSRALYDWYLANESKTGRKPWIIDADDIMNNPAAVRQLCTETNLDPDAVQYEWEEKHEPDVLKASFLSTINQSKGILKGLDARDLDIEIEKTKWKAEFGDRIGEEMAEFVYKAMPDYEYMLSQPTRATGGSASAKSAK